SQLCDDVAVSLADKLVQGNSAVVEIPSKNAVLAVIDFDTRNAPFNDPRLVQAIKKALDHNAFLKIGFGGHGSVTNDVPVAQTDALFPSDLAWQAPDLAGAKQLLQEANATNFKFTLHTTNDNSITPTVARLLLLNSRRWASR